MQNTPGVSEYEALKHEKRKLSSTKKNCNPNKGMVPAPSTERKFVLYKPHHSCHTSARRFTVWPTQVPSKNNLLYVNTGVAADLPYENGTLGIIAGDSALVTTCMAVDFVPDMP